MDREKVIDQIRKMMLRTEANGATANEAEAAAAHVRYLLAKHNLDMLEVEHASLDEGYVERDVASARDYDSMFLGQLLKKHYFVYAYQRKGQITLFGSPDNVEVAEYVYGYLRREFRRLWREHKQATGAGRGEMRLYFMGLADGINARLEQERRRFTAQQSTALVALTAQLEQAVKDKYSIIAASVSTINGTADTYDAGKRDGQNIQMRDALKGDRSSRVGMLA